MELEDALNDKEEYIFTTMFLCLQVHVHVW